jgi:GT2 family glycosyltransferase
MSIDSKRLPSTFQEESSNLKSISIAIVLVNYNGLADTLECLPTILSQPIDPRNVIVVDNGSKNNESIEIRNQFPSITVLRSESNLGWSGGNNLGARHAIGIGAEWLFLLNNDTILLPGALGRLQEVLSTERLGILGPIVNEYYRPECQQVSVIEFNRIESDAVFQKVPQEPSQIGEGLIVPSDIVNGCAILARSDLFEKLNGIDDRFFLIHEESDFCLRAKSIGERIGLLTETLVLHKQSASFQKAGKPIPLYYNIRNLGLLLVRKRHTFGLQKNYLNTACLYFRYVHRCYARELALDNQPGIKAIAEGLTDFLLHRFGPKPKPSKLSFFVDKGLHAISLVKGKSRR